MQYEVYVWSLYRIYGKFLIEHIFNENLRIYIIGDIHSARHVKPLPHVCEKVRYPSPTRWNICEMPYLCHVTIIKIINEPMLSRAVPSNNRLALQNGSSTPRELEYNIWLEGKHPSWFTCWWIVVYFLTIRPRWGKSKRKLRRQGLFTIRISCVSWKGLPSSMDALEILLGVSVKAAFF